MDDVMVAAMNDPSLLAVLTDVMDKLQPKAALATVRGSGVCERLLHESRRLPNLIINVRPMSLKLLCASI